MCGGNRRAHHQQQQAMRQATAEANRFEASLRAAEERNAAMAEAMKPKVVPAPITTNAMLGVRAIKPRKSTKSGTLGSRRGIASLRIPLNLGQSGGGTNIPS
jgi:hypothetical protein